MRKKIPVRVRRASVLAKKDNPLCSAETAEQLLEPILEFFTRAGMTAARAQASFDRAWKRTQKSKAKKIRIQLTPLANPSPYVKMISVWTKSPLYLDRYGEAKVLPWSGKSGFCFLVKSVDNQLAPEVALETLLRFGNVSLRPGRRVRLLNPFFTIRSSQYLAFEPSANFLKEAAEAVNSRSQAALEEDPQQFWRMVDSDSLPEELVASYRSFISSRSLSFLQDVDDWLSSHVSKESSKNPRWRAGLGLFSITKPSNVV